MYLLETPGASYQDTGLAFKVWQVRKGIAGSDAYLHYRTDNANSSVKAAAKYIVSLDEFKSIEEFLEKRPELKRRTGETGYIFEIYILSVESFQTYNGIQICFFGEDA